METAKKFSGVLAVVAVVIAIFALLSGGAKTLGGSTDDFFNANGGFKVDGISIIDGSGNVAVDGETVVDGFTQGGGVVTLTDANGGTYTLTQAELLSGNYLSFAAGGAGQAVIALTLPASSTLTTLIPNAGDCREYIYDASALAAATTTTITAGTGIDLIAYTTNDDVIDGAEFAEIRFCRQADSDVTVFTTEMLNAD